MIEIEKQNNWKYSDRILCDSLMIPDDHSSQYKQRMKKRGCRYNYKLLLWLPDKLTVGKIK